VHAKMKLGKDEHNTAPHTYTHTHTHTQNNKIKVHAKEQKEWQKIYTGISMGIGT
jgi:hypothetical protein